MTIHSGSKTLYEPMMTGLILLCLIAWLSNTLVDEYGCVKQVNLNGIKEQFKN